MKSRFEEAIEEIEKEKQKPRSNHYVLALVILLIVAVLISLTYFMYNKKSVEIVINEEMPPYPPGEGQGSEIPSFVSEENGGNVPAETPPPLPDFPI